MKYYEFYHHRTIAVLVLVIGRNQKHERGVVSNGVTFIPTVSQCVNLKVSRKEMGVLGGWRGTHTHANT
jgi:hypothetical protein